VATSDDIPGLGPKDERPRLNTAADLTGVRLTTTEGFILSRIDGRASYDDICRMSSLKREETLSILRKLKQDRLILGPLDKIAPVKPRKTHRTPSPERTTRKTPPLERSMRKTPPPVQVTEEMLRKAQERSEGKAAPAEPELLPVLERLDDGSPVDPADLIEGHGLSAETKKRIIRLHRRLRRLSPHELLGVPADADKATVRRAFAVASKELHPDRYYGKDLAAFREKLAKIFARMTEAVQEMEKAKKGK